jgi:hypothetical protein
MSGNMGSLLDAKVVWGVRSMNNAQSGAIMRWWKSRVGYRLLREATLMFALYGVYRSVRVMVRNHDTAAVDHARSVIAFERHLGLFTELHVQDLFLGNEALVRFINGYYLFAHFSMTILALAVLYLIRPAGYLKARRILLSMTGIALLVHVTYPLAPPRMFPGTGFVDTGALFGPGAYGDGNAFGKLANQFAAMPSMHFGWSMVVAWAFIVHFRGRWRWLTLAHPALTLTGIVATANHYWLDAIVACIIFVAVLVIDDAVTRRRSQRHLAQRQQARIDLTNVPDPHGQVGVATDEDLQRLMGDPTGTTRQNTLQSH